MGGIEKVVEDISTLLLEKNHYCEVVCLNKCSKSNVLLKEKEVLKKIQINRIPFIDLKYYKIAPKVFGFAKKFDILHVHGIGFFSDFLLLTKFLHKKPVIISSYGGIFHTKNIGIVKWAYFYLWNRFLLNFADKIIAISKNDFDLVKKISKKTFLCEIGVGFEAFENINVRREKNCFLFVGRFAKNKKIENLIETFSKIISRNEKVKLYIVGKDELNNRQKFEQQINSKNLEKNVFIINPLDEKELLDYFSKAEFFVSASDFESFGISAVEAMHLGIIPILNDIKSFGNIVENAKNGFIVNFSAPDATAEKIIEIMNLPKNEKNAVSFAAKKTARLFQWSEKFKQLEQIYLQASKKN
ncbi:MAG: glycosyltransferase family 4 protein [Candidatus Diapherotrites archaeon]|nr:glycosyltransferase family 4 protein [Candidatus Diapherotrites archaeon]